jgi:hypothetical protein
MHSEFFLHAHLMRLNRFDAYIQFVRQFRSAKASADERENLQLTIALARLIASWVRKSRDFGLQWRPKPRHKTRMNKHSRAFGRPGKGKRRCLSTLERKQLPGKQVIPNQLVELATDAIRDGHTTVETFIAPFHPDLRFSAFRAYTAAMLAFMAKWRR